MMRSPSISREVTAGKIVSGLNTSNNARRRSRGQQPHQRVQRNSRVHPVSYNIQFSTLPALYLYTQSYNAMYTEKLGNSVIAKGN